ncbi:MAG: DUF4286 family protein [Bacteroidota bacterium]
MILYNVTVSLDESIHEDWLQWMKDKHVPDVMATGCFIENKMLRLLNEEDNGITYAMQYLSPDMDTYERYQSEFAPALQHEYRERYKDKFAAFRTILEVVHHHIHN